MSKLTFQKTIWILTVSMDGLDSLLFDNCGDTFAVSILDL